jgi:hypothetical protein
MISRLAEGEDLAANLALEAKPTLTVDSGYSAHIVAFYARGRAPMDRLRRFFRQTGV